MFKLADLFKSQCIRLAYKNKFALLPRYHSGKLLSLYFNQSILTRQSHNIIILPNYTNLQHLHKKLLNYKIGSIWNILPNNIKAITMTLKSFVNRLKVTLLANMSFTVLG